MLEEAYGEGHTSATLHMKIMFVGASYYFYIVNSPVSLSHTDTDHAHTQTPIKFSSTMRISAISLLLLPTLATAFLFPSPSPAAARKNTRLYVGSNAKIDVPSDLVGKLDPSR